MPLPLHTLLLMALALVGQAPSVPEFSGQWVQDSPPLAGRNPPVCGRGCAMTQSVNKLAVKDLWNDTITYDLTGKPTVDSSTSGGFTVEATTTAAWEPGALVITRKTKQTFPASSRPALTTIARLTLKDEVLTISGAYPELGTGVEKKYEVTYRRKPR